MLWSITHTCCGPPTLTQHTREPMYMGGVGGGLGRGRVIQFAWMSDYLTSNSPTSTGALGTGFGGAWCRVGGWGVSYVCSNRSPMVLCRCEGIALGVNLGDLGALWWLAGVSGHPCRDRHFSNVCSIIIPTCGKLGTQENKYIFIAIWVCISPGRV